MSKSDALSNPSAQQMWSAFVAGLGLAVLAPAAVPEALPEAFIGGRSTTSADPIWEVLRVPELLELWPLLRERNVDLAMAQERVRAASLAALEARAGMMPQISANAGVSAQPLSAFVSAGPSAATSPASVLTSVQATLDLAYRFDSLWRQYRVFEATEHGAEASRHERDALGVGLFVQLAEAYLDVVASRERVAVLNRQLETNRALLELVGLRFESGEATGLDVLQQRQQIASTQARIPDARRAERLSLRRLAVLFGAFRWERELPTVLPTLGSRPGTGAPVDLAKHRPELRGAAARMSAAASEAQAARLVHGPSLALTARGGVQFRDVGASQTNELWSIGLNLSLPIFSGLRDEAIESRGASRLREATLAHDSIWLAAVAEVESALVREDEQGVQLVALRAQRAAAQAAFAESKARYAQGLTPYLSVLTALNGLHGAELSIVQGRRASWSARIELLRALGGPWTRNILDAENQ